MITLALSFIAYYLFFYSSYWLLLTIAGLSGKSLNVVNDEHQRNPELLIVLPAYKPNTIFFEVVKHVENAMKGRNICVYVLFQQCDNPRLVELVQSKGFFVEEKSFEHLGGNSYQHALQHIAATIENKRITNDWNPEFVMLIDKDNLLSMDFFKAIPASFFDCYDIIQGRRTAITTSGAVAFFDTISEKLNDFMFRKAKMNIGSMIEISGSGSLIETDLFIQTIRQLDAKAPGFDKNFMVNLLIHKRAIRTIYWPKSELQEEKTAAIDSFNPQRLRWFGEQYYNAIYMGKELLSASLKYRRMAAFDYLITLWRPPRSIQILITPMLAVVELLWYALHREWLFKFPLLLISCFMLSLSLLVFLFSERMMIQAFRHSLSLPMLACYNLINALQSIKKKNQGKFIHTIHKL